MNARFFFVTGRFCKIRVCSPSSARPRVAIPCQVFCLRYCLACTYLLVRLSLCLRLLLENRRLCLYCTCLYDQAKLSEKFLAKKQRVDEEALAVPVQVFVVSDVSALLLVLYVHSVMICVFCSGLS